MTRAAWGRAADEAAGDLPLVIAALRAGAAPRLAWRAAGVRCDADGLPVVAGGPADGHEQAASAAARLAGSHGVSLATVLEEIVVAMDAERAVRAVRRHALAGPRMSARVLLWLPVGVVVAGPLLGLPPVWSWRGVWVWGVVAVGAALLGAGSLWSRSLIRRASSGTGDTVAEVSIAGLLAAMLTAGCSVPVAASEVGAAWQGPVGDGLQRLGAALLWGASWHAASTLTAPEVSRVISAMEQAWEHGSSCVPALRWRARQVREAEEAAAKDAAARVAVTMALPLGLCFLPGFVLVAVVPGMLMWSLA